MQGKLGDAKAAHLYYYNPATKQLEVVAENLAIEGGCEPGTSDNIDHNAVDSADHSAASVTVGTQPEVIAKPVDASVISYVVQVLLIYLPTEPTADSTDVARDNYIVQKGDSLWKIAKNIYGKGQMCSKIYEANKDIIKNPHKLRIGQSLIIPQ